MIIPLATFLIAGPVAPLAPTPRLPRTGAVRGAAGLTGGGVINGGPPEPRGQVNMLAERLPNFRAYRAVMFLSEPLDLIAKRDGDLRTQHRLFRSAHKH